MVRDLIALTPFDNGPNGTPEWLWNAAYPFDYVRRAMRQNELILDYGYHPNPYFIPA